MFLWSMLGQGEFYILHSVSLYSMFYILLVYDFIASCRNLLIRIEVL